MTFDIPTAQFALLLTIAVGVWLIVAHVWRYPR